MVLSLKDRCVLKVSEKQFGTTWREILNQFRLAEFEFRKGMKTTGK